MWRPCVRKRWKSYVERTVAADEHRHLGGARGACDEKEAKQNFDCRALRREVCGKRSVGWLPSIAIAFLARRAMSSW